MNSSVLSETYKVIASCGWTVRSWNTASTETRASDPMSTVTEAAGRVPTLRMRYLPRLSGARSIRNWTCDLVTRISARMPRKIAIADSQIATHGAHSFTALSVPAVQS